MTETSVEDQGEHKNGNAHFYRPRDRVGKGFTHVCLSVCLSVFADSNF